MKKIFGPVIVIVGLLLALAGVWVAYGIATTPDQIAQPTQISQDATPVAQPSTVPTDEPTKTSTHTPTDKPTNTPTDKPTNTPTDKPTNTPKPKSPTPVPTQIPATAVPTKQSTVVSTPPPTVGKVANNTATATRTEIPSTGGKLQDGGFIVENDGSTPKNSSDQGSPGLSRKITALLLAIGSVILGLVAVYFGLRMIGVVGSKKAPKLAKALDLAAVQQAEHAAQQARQVAAAEAAAAQQKAAAEAAAAQQKAAAEAAAAQQKAAAEQAAGSDALSKLLGGGDASTPTKLPTAPAAKTQGLKRATPQIPLKGPTPDQN